MDQPKRGKCYIVSGIHFGDQGKGTIVDFLARDTACKLVVRHGGGPQAAHHVVLPDSTWHCFSHYASGMFVPHCHSLLSRFMIIYPQTLQRETLILEKKTPNPLERLHIDMDCFVVTPYHQMVSRVMETLRSRKKGSTGLGVGQAAEDAYSHSQGHFPRTELFQKKERMTLQIKDLLDEGELRQKLQMISIEKKNLVSNLLKMPHEQLVEHLYPGQIINSKEVPELTHEVKRLAIDQVMRYMSNNSPDNVENSLLFYKDFVSKYRHCFCNTQPLLKAHLERGETVIFEGSQGALLDLIHGFYPHTTKTICTLDNASILIKQFDIDIDVTKIGVLRCYSHRHGEGSFVTHNHQLSQKLSQNHNRYSQWQGDFKVGLLDAVMIRYGVEVLQPNYLAITNIDRITAHQQLLNTVCSGYTLDVEDLSEREMGILQRRFVFSIEGAQVIIQQIKLVGDKEAFRSEELTLILNKCRPIIQKLEALGSPILSSPYLSEKSSQAVNLLGYVEQVSGKSICIVSESPTYEGKSPLMKF